MLDNNSLKKIYSHAMQEYPNECCGIVTGDGMGITIVHKCINIQNELHKKEPERYPRDARTAYHIDPKEMLNIFKDAEKKGLKVFAKSTLHTFHKKMWIWQCLEMSLRIRMQNIL